MAFELTHVRALLLIFPNTFEYFFIAYEAIRSRWSPLAFALRWWVVTAAVIWVCIKLPQEYWIHIAQLDVTDELAAHAWAWPLLIGLLLVLALVLWFVVRPRLRPPDWPLRLEADPLHEDIDTAAEQAAWAASYGRVRSTATVEKVVLLGLLAVVFGNMLPGVHTSSTQLFVGVAVVVVVNAAITLAAARRSMSVESITLAFAARLAANALLVLLADRLLGRRPRRHRPGSGAVLPDVDQPDHDVARPLDAGPRPPASPRGERREEHAVRPEQRVGARSPALEPLVEHVRRQQRWRPARAAAGRRRRPRRPSRAALRRVRRSAGTGVVPGEQRRQHRPLAAAVEGVGLVAVHAAGDQAAPRRPPRWR